MGFTEGRNHEMERLEREHKEVADMIRAGVGDLVVLKAEKQLLMQEWIAAADSGTDILRDTLNEHGVFFVDQMSEKK